MTRDEVKEMPFRDLLALMELTQIGCSRRFDITYRTVQRWYAGDRECPPYVKLMMAELSGVIRKKPIK